ncbi:glycosyltransferase [Stakelama sp. CBK3Z-3]|uniref:Glycosyltransferase n=1 Tax=Stakelama flava TaxID=2860338 RepID=A0ABS6XLB8_9SPHN|nr:glycosyltransferase [Stakelama flava]MBW4331008.1 glycosyltransferase [Stakelama flava]
MLRVLTLSTLFPDASRPNFGIFVERQTGGLAAHPDVALKVVAPIGLPPFPLSMTRRYRALTAQPRRECWNGLDVYRPRFINIPGTGGRWHAAMLTRALVPLLDQLRRDFRFDIIDTEFFFPDGPAALALGRRYGVPVSIKARGADIHYWGHARRTAGQVAQAVRDADGLLAVSQAMAGDIAALATPHMPVAVHHTGIDRSAFGVESRKEARAALDIDDSPLIVSLGALIARKRHDIVIGAIAALPGVRLHIIGEGPERARLQAQIDRLGIGDRVTLLGAIAHAHLPRHLAAANVMALASASEGLANAWVEALASGTPIVITDAGGAREMVTAPAAGRIAEPTPEAFAEEIADLLAHPPPAETVKATARRFSWEVNTAALYDHLARLVR